MRNKKQNSNALPEADLQNPYQVIADFFDYGDLSDHRERISTWMAAVDTNDYWRRSSPSDLLFYYEKLLALIEAAHLIHHERDKVHKTAVEILQEKGYEVETNLLHPALYFGWGRYQTLWDHFPRSLSLEEYIDPYLVIPQFFEVYDLDEWRQEMHELLSDGLSANNAAVLSGEERNLMLTEKSLHKLIEAVHLIDVRETDCINDFRKIKPYTLDKPCSEIPAAEILRVEQPDDDKQKIAWKEEQTKNLSKNKRGKDTYQEAENNGGSLTPDSRDGIVFVEIVIGGNCLVDDQPISVKEVKVRIPVKVSELNNDKTPTV